MPEQDLKELRRQYELQVRYNVTPDGSGSTAYATSNVVRWAANQGRGWSEISWSNLDQANADEVIEEQISFFSDQRASFVWRVHDDDQPPDLGSRLIRAGLTHVGNSAVMVGLSSALAQPVRVPDGTRVVRVTDQEGVDLLISTHEKVFGHDHRALRQSILARLETAPHEMDMYVVTANGIPLSAARTEFLPNRDFATLWGGGTVPEWRGRGIYRALVSLRAQVAVERGYQYLSVLASSQSKPILSTLGFDVISNIATYQWEPPVLT
jgi:GNAT superfamily N-acetyltransferase